jgi:hypothetical protein
VRPPRPSPAGPLILAAACCGLATCGTVLGGIGFRAPGEAETVVNLAPGQISYWTQFSASYGGDMAASFDVELSQEGQVVGRTICDPVHPLHVCVNRYNGFVNHSWNCKMVCSSTLLRGGPTRVRARFSVDGGPRDLRVNEAHLMIRQ